jgi:hypothetical protein
MGSRPGWGSGCFVGCFADHRTRVFATATEEFRTSAVTPYASPTLLVGLADRSVFVHSRHARPSPCNSGPESPSST